MILIGIPGTFGLQAGEDVSQAYRIAEGVAPSAASTIRWVVLSDSRFSDPFVPSWRAMNEQDISQFES